MPSPPETPADDPSGTSPGSFSDTSRHENLQGEHLLITGVSGAAEAARRLDAGGVVALPTETVYGLAAAADQPDAIARVFSIKGRPVHHPLILHIAELADLQTWAIDIPDAASALGSVCWPGPLTLLLRRSKRVNEMITGGRNSVAIRVPAHALAQQVLALSGPFVAPSANRFGHVSPTSADHVLADLAEFMDPNTDGVLDGGPCHIGVESTILDCTVTPMQILRHGGISAEEIQALLLKGSLEAASGPQRASGMMESHYAPRIPVRLVESDHEMQITIAECEAAQLQIAIIDVSSDLVAYARDLYALLRNAETTYSDVIIARLPAAMGLGHAIRDRLTKAAAPHPR